MTSFSHRWVLPGLALSALSVIRGMQIWYPIGSQLRIAWSGFPWTSVDAKKHQFDILQRLRGCHMNAIDPYRRRFGPMGCKGSSVRITPSRPKKLQKIQSLSGDWIFLWAIKNFW